MNRENVQSLCSRPSRVVHRITVWPSVRAAMSVVGVRAGPAQQDYRLDSEDDLPDLCVRFHVAMSVDDVTQGKGPADYGSQAAFRNMVKHIFLGGSKLRRKLIRVGDSFK